MRAMILAAGLGKRMRPLTETCPKPLLQAGGRHLIDYHLERLANLGVKHLAINTHWLAQQLSETLGDNNRGMSLEYFYEPVLLETAGGIRNALPVLDEGQDTPFLVINGDIYTEIDLDTWLAQAQSLIATSKACLALVENPEHNLEGDFGLEPSNGNLLLKAASNSMTYAGLGLFRPSFFCSLANGPAALAPLLYQSIDKQNLKGALVNAFWMDVGTPERLRQLNHRLQQRQ